MKKFLTIILCIIYVTASSGATVNFHYCMGKFIGWDVKAATDKTCDTCGMHKEEKKGCCNDAHASFKVQKEQLASFINAVPASQFFYVHQLYPAFEKSISFTQPNAVNAIHAPPLIQNIPSFLRNCVFRI